MAVDKRIREIYPLTPLQRGLLFDAVSASGEDPYVVQVTARLDGELDPAAFTEAWRELADRHAVLRTAFVTKGQREPVQVTFDSLAVPVEHLDWRHLEPGEIEAAQVSVLAADRARGFALNRPPLIRITLARLEDRAWWVLLSHHHLILDGWSQPMLFADLFAILEARRAGRAPTLPAVTPLSDYVAWLRRQEPEEATAFWRDRLGDWTYAPLPGKGEERDEPSVAIVRRLDARTTAAVEQLARTARVTPSTVCQAAWALVLERYAGRADVTFGVTVSGRTAPVPGIERMVGLLINTLPLRLTVPREQSARTWLQRVGEEFRAVEDHAQADLAALGRIAGATPERPLFDTLVAYENFPVAFDANGSGVRIGNVRSYERTSLAAALVVVPGTVMSIRLQVDPSRLSVPVAEGMADRFVSMLTRMAQAPDAPLAALDDTSDVPVSQRSLQRGDPQETVVARFRRMASSFPNRVAVSGPGGALTYAALDEASDRVAVALRHEGTAVEDRVGICFERSTRAIVAMLGVLKAGAAYVPVDPLYPDDRVTYTFADSGCRLVLTTTGLASRMAELGAKPLAVDALPNAQSEGPAPAVIEGANAAYVIYTSGSTGRPKGVVVTHANVLRLFDGAEPLFDFTADDVWSVFHSFAFDFSVWEIWGPLLHGASALVVAQDVTRDPAAFRTLLASERVTICSQTPSAFGQLIAADAHAHEPLALREVVLGGEALRTADLGPWFARHGDTVPRIVNMYGITETTVHVTFRPVTIADVEHAGSPVGVPMPQLDVLLLDDLGRAVPDGAGGEICVAGDGLARGYLGRPALTAQRFVPHPAPRVPGERLYRSGDLARRTARGELEYLGRIDRQVKVRGFRIELGEIEAALSTHPEVVRTIAVAYAKDAMSTGLCAYVVATAGPDAATDLAGALRAHAAASLPTHMVPDAFVVIPGVPLTVNGKIDFDALPDPQASRLRAEPDEPETDVERRLAAAWAKGLGLERVGVTENYFALGGDSIRSIRIAGLAAESGIRFTIRQLLEHPTVRDLARVAGAATNDASDAVGAAEPFRLLEPGERELVPPEAVDAFPLARLQAGMLFHAGSGEGPGLYLDQQSFRLAMPVDEAALRAAIDETVEAFAPLRTGFVVGEGRRPLQFVLPHASLPVGWSDVRHLAPADQDEAIAAYIATERTRPYDLERPSLARITVHRLDDALLQLTVSFHHAILDGWSVALWESALLERYFARRAGLQPPRERPAPPYSTFVEAEQAAVDDAATRAFWERRVRSAPPSVLPRWPGIPANGASAPLQFPRGVAAGLTAQAAAAGLPLKSVLLAITGHVAARAAGAPAIPVGLVTNGRAEVEGGDRALGLFLNTLPVTLRSRGTWRALSTAAFEEEGAIAGPRRFPLQELVAMNGGVAPFECNFNLVHFHGFAGLSGRYPVTVVSASSVEAVDIPFSFNFSVDPNGGGLTFQLLAGESVSAAQRDSLVAAVERAVIAAATSLDDVADVFDDQTAAANREFNATVADVDLTPVSARVMTRLRNDPASPVLREAGGRLLSGAEVVRLVDEAGARLAGRIERGQPVVLWLTRSPELVAAMLAVLRAGGAYAPVDSTAPPARVIAILEELSALGIPPLLICDRAGVERLPERWRPLAIVADGDARGGAAIPQTSVEADDLAYVIFTSGSTGRPKGVMISHGALANHMGWMASRFPLTADDVVLQRTSPAFDAAVWEFWAPLLEGAILALAPEAATKDPAELLEAAVASGTTVLQLVPSVLDAVLTLPRPDGLRLKRLFCGGEALRAGVAAQARAQLTPEVVNLYGPTEATIDATFHCAVDSADLVVPIGHPVANMRAYVLDEQLDPVAIGAPGELCLAGAQLARGYAGQPALTAERFIPDPFSVEGGRLYRTGDIVRRMPDGTLHFSGRVDRQVKLGGNRLELEEVEAAIARKWRSGRVAVVAEARPDGPARLVAYLEGASDVRETAALEVWLGEQLPSYAVPRRFAFVADWPLLPSGKTDTARLPAAGTIAQALPAAETAGPQGELEEAMAAIWETVLGSSPIGALDDFFALGGDSIVALQLTARARRAGLAVTPADLFRHPTVRGLSAVAAAAVPTAAVPEAVRGPVPVTPIQDWFFDLGLARPNHWNQAVLLRCPKGITGAQLHDAVAILTRRHDALRLRFAASPAGARTMELVPASAVVDVVDAVSREEVTASCRAAQAELDVQNGPVFRARLIRYETDRQDRLLLVAHHLVVDGVSWRVLLEEVASLLLDPSTDLGPSPFPFTAWAGAAALREPDAAEVSYWRDEASRTLATLPLLEPGLPIEGRTATVARTLVHRSMGLLLRGARERLRAEMPELLLAALGQSLASLLGEREIGVLVERHGRDVAPGVDVGRTVGWFTVLQPVRLMPRAETGAAVRAAKDALRRVPAGGSSYLALARRGPDAAPPLPQVSLNYLGQFDASLGGPLAPAREDTGPSSDQANRRTTVLDVVALVQGGNLRLSASFDSRLLSERATVALLERMIAALEEQGELPQDEALSAWDVRDLPGCGLSAESLGRLTAEIPGLEAVYPASPVQRGLLFHSRMAAADSGVYVQQVVAELRGPLDAERLRDAWAETVARHEALRASFFDIDDVQLQVVRGEVTPAWRTVDWSALPAGAQAMRWEQLQAQDRAAGFDPAQPHLSRMTLVDFGGGAWRLLWTHHHLVMDGWSLPIVFADLSAAYREPGSLRPGPTLEAVVRRRLESDPAALLQQAVTELHGLDQPALVSEAGRSASSATTVLHLDVDRDVVRRLVNVVRSAGVGLASAVNAAFAIVLGRELGVRDVVHGVTVSGRSGDVPGIEQMVGLFIATLPLRTQLRGDMPVTALLKATQERLGALNERAMLPLGELQAALGLGPLFDAIVVFENYPMDAARLAPGESLQVESVTAVEQNHYPLSLYVHPDGDDLKLALHVDPSQMAPARAERFLAALDDVLCGWARADAEYVGNTPALSNAARKAALARDAGEIRTIGTSVDEAIAAWARSTPDATALTVDGVAMTYAQVVARADRIAAALRSRGIGVEDRVAVMLPRVADLPVALLGVMRAGAAFVPLDPAFPAARLAMILEDAAPRFVITAGEPPPGTVPSGVPTMTLRALLDSSEGTPPQRETFTQAPVPLAALAYVIFTSGSTGRPKGVEVSRKAFANACAAFRRRPGLSADDVVAAVTTVSFDIALNELLLPWTAGATIALVDRPDATNGVRLAAALEAAGATVLQSTPATWRLLAAAQWNGAGKVRSWCGGEALPSDLAADIATRSLEAWNLYGPTETTIWSSTGRLATPGPVDAGTAIDNTRLYIVDPDGQLLPPGVPGQLLIGGAGVARGYTGRPGITAAAFLPDPFSGEPGAVAYATGDLARWSPEGRLEVLGRVDRQIKINGYRVEPADIEVALRSADAVADAACTIRQVAGGPALVAFVVPAGGQVDPEALRRHLQGLLPAYMVPSIFVSLASLPLTANGKVDYKALPDQGLTTSHAREKAAPRGPVEQALAFIWQDAFGRTDIGVLDDFFDLGGHSLLATQIHAKLGRVFQGQVPLRELFDAPTIELLAQRLRNHETRPGAVERAAQLFVRVRTMSAEERQALRDRTSKAGEPVGA